uniref:Putative 26 kDa salivary gland protein a n=1 Tax=Ixodes ricinus TaxID=34613 RepID=A0A147BJE2_IXORI
MRSVIGVLTFTIFVFSFARGEVFEKYHRNIDSGEKYITVAFVLDGFPNKDANLHSNVGVWLKDSYDKAAKILSEKLKVEIKFEVTDILPAPGALTEEIKYRTVGGQMHGPTILDAVKKTYEKHINPDIICVVTKGKFYDGRLSNEVGFAKVTTLCEDMVPILLTFTSELVDDVSKTATLLSKLVKDSVDNHKWDKTDPRKDYFNGCNVRHKLKGDSDEEYYVLPIDKGIFYDF